MRKSNGIVNTLPPPEANWLARPLKRCWMYLAFLIITVAIISSLFRALTPLAKQYKKEVEHHLSQLLGESVSIQAMETGWHWFEPVIKLNQVSISDGKKEVVRLNKLLVGINLFSSLWHWQIQPGIFFIDDLQLSLRQTEKGWQIDGIDEHPQMAWEAATYRPLLAWVLAQQKIVIKNLSAQIHMQDGTLIPLQGFNLNVSNWRGHYKIKGSGGLAQTTATHFQVLANLTLDPYALNKATGHAFFSIQGLLPAQWQGFVPKPRFQLLSGKGNVELWLDIAKGKLQSAQTRLRFNHLAWLDHNTQKNQLIQAIKANLAWQTTPEGWALTGDRLQLRMGDTKWPENSLMIRYQKESQAYFVFVKNILLESLFATSFAWPESVKPLLTLKPHGQLQDMQVKIENNNLDYLLTRFTDLGWQEQNRQPGANNLSGAIHWQPSGGRLELTGEKTTITQKNQKPITFSALTTAFDWQVLDDGLRINMERLVVNHPNLMLNARGILNKITANSSGQLRLTGEFSGQELQRLMKYLPPDFLKPKLERWFKEDVKRISKANGAFAVNGLLADFPFDKQPGEFVLQSHLTGVDLIFAPEWPLTRDIEAHLRVNKRSLDADIVHANFQGLMVNQGHLLIDDVGLDRETLLVHSKTEAKANEVLAYMMASPMKQKLSALSMLNMEGLIDLELKVEAPLYPENDDVLVLGDINFKNDKVDVHHSLDDVELKGLTGSLQFNEQGVLNSNLNATILESPVHLIMRSIHGLVPYTEVKMSGKTSIDALSKKFNLSLFSLMRGELQMDGLLKLTDDPNDLDHLSVRTSLQGLAVDLPPPLGKAAITSIPLAMDIDFNPQKAMRLRVNYGQQLTSNLWFSPTKEGFILQKGQIQLGNDKIPDNRKKGLQLVGSLANFELKEWLNAKGKLMSETGNNSIIQALNRIDIKLHKAKIGQEKYDELAIKAAKLADEDWSINLNQAKIAAKLHYHASSNTLSGQFTKLRLENKLKEAQVVAENSSFKPTDLPNLNLQIASFQYGDLALGEMSLKTKSTPHRWQLDYCKIKTPFYLLSAKGEWNHRGSVNTTQLQADLQINNLAESLKQWKISPAVEAQQGYVQFQGGWTGTLSDFALAKVTGQLALGFKDGRITNLSPETEEKLGLGKLLSILSLQTIPRRLKLDFSDLAKTGYSFDKFEGSFEVAHGVMTTQDSYIDGPVAYASMKGNLDIAKQLYNLDLRISPHITASLPVVATIAGGPIAGLAAWVASKIINQSMDKISGYTYKVSGPWRQPLVEQVSIIKKRLSSG